MWQNSWNSKQIPSLLLIRLISVEQPGILQESSLSTKIYIILNPGPSWCSTHTHMGKDKFVGEKNAEAMFSPEIVPKWELKYSM